MTTDGSVHVEVARVADPELLDTLNALLPQLSSGAAPLSAYELEDIVNAPTTTLFVVRGDRGHVLGSLTLAIFRVPTGVRAWIEDVVVDEESRGRGIGEALVMAALDLAQRSHARTVELTSRPSRESANRLYLRLGFEERATNVYRKTLESE
jgi:ribosomal protein S18 acetylase RimI-like enzyme